MEYKKLNEETIEQYLDYLKSAMKEEPEEMLTEEIDENAIIGKFLFFQETAPSSSNAVKGSLWFNNSTGILSAFNGSTWVNIGAVWK